MRALVCGAAVYGFSLGAMHSWTLAATNLWKFPLLILVTAGVCAAAYAASARLLAPSLDAREVGRVVVAVYRDTAVLLASLATVALFLSVTLTPAESRLELRDYPLFLGLNIVLFGTAGSFALVRHAKALLSRSGVGMRRGLAVVFVWLALSLLVGGQASFYLRPFFGIAAVDPHPPLFEGSNPDFRGAHNFFEVVRDVAGDLAG